MGYDVCITRADDSTENGGHEIRFEEWERLVNEDPDLEIEYAGRLTVEDWERLIEDHPDLAGRKTDFGILHSPEQWRRIEELARGLKRGVRADVDKPGYYDTADWKSHPLGEQRCFWFHGGNIETKNPDYAALTKMLELAEKLGARVQGDDHEIYRKSDRGVEYYDRDRPRRGWQPLEAP
jgi:hypothetical protein